MMGFLYPFRLTAGITLLGCLVLAPSVSAQLYHIPSADPGSFSDIENVVNNDIPGNLNEAMCGGWDLGTELNGVFGREESVCPPSAQEPIGARCMDQNGVEWTKAENNLWRNDGGAEQSDADMDANAKRTNPDRGFIANVKGVPGRENQQALGNFRSGMGLRKESGGDQDITGHPPRYNGQTSGFTYPKNNNTVCGFTTICRSGRHPDKRTVPPYRTMGGRRDEPGFLCDHPCQRPLDTPGKPGNWDPSNSRAVSCGRQEPYEPIEDRIRYACGGGETKGPGEGFCPELQANGPLGGLCEDLNKWVYILWSKKIGECHVPTTEPPFVRKVDIIQYEKGQCGFPQEISSINFPNTFQKLSDNWTPLAVYECCSDDYYVNVPFDPGIFNPENQDDDGYYIPEGGEIEVGPQPGYVGKSCKTCTGEKCRVSNETDQVIINDIWILTADGWFPNDVCLDFSVEENYRRKTEQRSYISFFRDYNEASYERAKMDQSGVQPDGSQKELIRDDDHKKERIPVACYGFYDLSPENAKQVGIVAKDKHCTIGAYYDSVNFWEMKKTQRGIGFFREQLPNNPFNDPLRPFDEQRTLWFPQLGNAFSLINDRVFSSRMDNNLTFTILAPDSAEQRATVQIDERRPFSSGSLIRAFDDTVTNDFDYKKDRRSIAEWWQSIETEMHEMFSPPIIRLLLATTWSIDLDPLDPIYVPPVPPDPADEAVDPRSETIEVQIEAREDLLGDIIAFMERARLMRVEGEPIPVVVPIGNPTELRIIAHGWEVWAEKQRSLNPPGPGSGRADEVAAKLLEYADRIDDVRKLRAQLPRYAGALLEEQKVVGRKLAEWLTQNIDAYDAYVQNEIENQFALQRWRQVQDTYRTLHDKDSLPWCRNDRYTTPIYSLLDPWMPKGPGVNSPPDQNVPRDVTGGYLQYANCLTEIINFTEDAIDSCSDLSTYGLCFNTIAPSCGAPVFDRYARCVNLFAARRAEDGPEYWPTLEVCDEYMPPPPNFPFEEADRAPDLVLDFTAFKEPPKTIKLPVLKPTQIRIDFSQIRPPAMENSDEPSYYPELPELPELPEEITQQVFDSIPNAMVFKEAAVLKTIDGPALDPEIPEIEIPETDSSALAALLDDMEDVIFGMGDEFRKFWKSVTLERCEGGIRGNDCVAPGTEQDCVEPYHDPKNRCVHFEGDLMERMQRIGSRPAIFLIDDFRPVGTFRDPVMHGQENCEREDWACQLLNARNRKGREGWLIDISDEYDPETLMRDIRQQIREATQNTFEDAAEAFPYDFPQEQMFEIYRIPEGERIDRRIEHIDNDTNSDS